MAVFCAYTMDRAVHRPNPGSAGAVRICGLGWAGFAIGAAALRTGERGQLRRAFTVAATMI